MNLDMKRPCANCPFRREGAIPLNEGRLEGIIKGLAADDGRNFVCHKTTGSTEREHSACMGAIAYMRKVGRSSVSIRFGLRFGLLDPAQLDALDAEILEPGADGMPIYQNTSPERNEP